jgi:hypothetical protein
MNRPIDMFMDLQRRNAIKDVKQQFIQLVQEAQYVGEVYSISYESALVQIHDHHRRKVGGIPSLSFLVATRINPKAIPDEVDHTTEDCSIILLRVMDASHLPNHAEAERIRVEIAQRVSGERDLHWDQRAAMDVTTHDLLSFAGVKCRVIGTFHLDNITGGSVVGSPVLNFGSDISNYYPNRGLKVYKPNGSALEAIVNYRDPLRPDSLNNYQVTIGRVRYASTDRAFQGVDNVLVNITPADLLEQKTALFGMTSTSTF